MYKGIADKRGEGKGKGERQMNGEFQRVARREKKASLSEKCREIEENNRMGKTRDLLKKIIENKGNISCKDGHNKE